MVFGALGRTRSVRGICLTCLWLDHQEPAEETYKGQNDDTDTKGTLEGIRDIVGHAQNYRAVENQKQKGQAAEVKK